MAAFIDTLFGVSFHYGAYCRSEFLLLCESIGFRVTKYVVVNEPDGRVLVKA